MRKRRTTGGKEAAAVSGRGTPPYLGLSMVTRAMDNEGKKSHAGRREAFSGAPSPSPNPSPYTWGIAAPPPLCGSGRKVIAISAISADTRSTSLNCCAVPLRNPDEG